MHYIVLTLNEAMRPVPMESACENTSTYAKTYAKTYACKNTSRMAHAMRVDALQTKLATAMKVPGRECDTAQTTGVDAPLSSTAPKGLQPAP
jgi:hypothetical protein